MPYRVENILKKEIVCYKQFLLFSQCFPQLYIFSEAKCVREVMGKLFTKRQIFRLVQIENICRKQNESQKKENEICFGKGRKHCGKRRKCRLPAFSPFPTMFSKGFFPRFITSRDCVEQLSQFLCLESVAEIFNCIKKLHFPENFSSKTLLHGK